MKVTLYMATSLNGYIADVDGNEDFLSHSNWVMFAELVEKYGNFVVGRETYEKVKNWDADYGFDDFDEAERVIVTRNTVYQPPSGYTVTFSPEEAIATLTKENFDEILITGGARLNSSFMKAGLVDEIIINVNPVAVGRGINLFKEEDFETDLELLSNKSLPDEIVHLHYRVKKK